MNREYKKRITQNLTYLKERLVDLDPIIDKLIEKDVFQLEHRSKVEQVTPPTPQKKFNEFIQILLASPDPNAYHVFIEALQEERYFYIVERLQNCYIKESYGGTRHASSLHGVRQFQLHRSTTHYNQDDSGASGGSRHREITHRDQAAMNPEQMASVMTKVLTDFGGKLTEELVSSFEKHRRNDMMEMERRMEDKLEQFKMDWDDEKERILKSNEKAISELRDSFEKLRRSNDELTRLREKYDNLKQLQKEMREKENERWQRLSVTNNENVQLREQNELLEQKVESLKDKVAELKSKNNLLNSNYEQNRLELEHLTLTNQALRGELAEKERERNELKQEVEKAHQQIQDMMAHQKESTQKNDDDDIYRSALEQQNEKLDEIYQAVHALGAKEKSLLLRPPSKGLYIGGSAVHRSTRPKAGNQQQKSSNNE